VEVSSSIREVETSDTAFFVWLIGDVALLKECLLCSLGGL